MYTNSANGNGDVETTKFTDGDWGQTKRCGNQPERYQSRENRSLTTSPVLGAAVCDKPTLKRTGRKFHQRSPSIRFYVEIRYGTGMTLMYRFGRMEVIDAPTTSTFVEEGRPDKR
jgi:hypothetical protein